MARRSAVSKTRERVRLQAIVDLLSGRRLYVEGPTGREHVYLGESKVNRRDPYWVEHRGGRTYFVTAEEAVDYVLPHVGVKALEDREIFAE